MTMVILTMEKLLKEMTREFNDNEYNNNGNVVKDDDKFVQ